MQLTQCLSRAARVTPDRVATTDGAERRTWRDTENRVARLAAGLLAKGLAPGDRVAVLALNSARYFELVHAVWWAGGVVTPLNIRWTLPEVIYALEDSGARILAFDSSFVDIGKAAVSQVSTVQNGLDLEAEFERMIADHAPAPDVMRAGEDLAGIFYTGGTTGFPKGVMLPHRAIWANSATVASQMKLDGTAVYLHAAPMFHIADFACTMANMFVGGSHVFIPGFDADRVLDALDQTPVTWTLMVPTMIKLLLDRFNARDGAHFGGLTDIVFGASPMPEPLLRQAIALGPHLRWFHAYGQTEMSPMISLQLPEFITLNGPHASKLRSAGQACYVTDLRIVDAEGQEVPAGVAGEIIARGPNMMQGYWNKPEATAEAIRNGWVHTGDAGYLDDDGFLYVADRLKDMIITGGENVYSTEVENAVGAHPDVSEVAVIGIPHETWGEAVHAIIRPVTGKTPTLDDILDHVRPLIAGFKCPRSVELRDEPFPVSGAGKVLKRDLRAPYWADRST